MKVLRTTATVLALAALTTACSDAPPTAPEAIDTPSALEARGGIPGPDAAARADLLSDIPVDGTLDGTDISGTLSVTEITTDGAGGFLVDGVLTITDGLGETVSLPIEDAPADLSRTSSMAMAMQQRGPDEAGVCDILFLDLGPIFLDLLGLTVDLSEIVLDIDAVSGQGNLLGNLLCAVTGLLDPGSALDNLLDRINTLLGNATDLLGDIPATATSDLGSFLGTLSITDLSLNDAGQLLASGTISGIATATDGTIQTVNTTFQTTADLATALSALTSTSAPAMALSQHNGRGANEAGACDILFLDLGPIFLDLLGLTVDLSPIELDIDAQRGSGKLLGNLLCAVTGLLDSGGPLDGLNDLLDQINDLLSGLLG